MIIGTCSKCKGPVTVPDNWMGTKPAIPSCEYCNATPINPYGPIIETENK